MEVDLVARLYSTLHSNREDEVIELCRRTKYGPLEVCSIHGDTVLHIATFIKKLELANKLFDDMPENLLIRLNHRNDWGNTILHNASTANRGLEMVKKLLIKAPQLLQVRNYLGETAIFQATRYGKKDTFEFLSGEVDKFCELHNQVDRRHFFERDDKTNILHLSILTENFDMALVIATRYPDLCSLRARDHITALQILACMPTAFKSGTKQGFLKELIYSRVSTDERGTLGDGSGQSMSIIHKSLSFILGTGCKGKLRCILPMIEGIREAKKGHEDVLKLAKILIRLDSSWKDTHKPHGLAIPEIVNALSKDDFREEGQSSKPQRKETLELAGIRKYGGEEEPVDDLYQRQVSDIESGRTSYVSSISNTDETPLFLATRKGCIEIVEEIFNMFPQAVEYLDHDGQNLLHVAVKNRNLNIFQLVEQRNLHFRGLREGVDKRGNSILHMVASRGEASVDAKITSPALQLHEDLLLFKYVEERCPRSLVKHHNNQMKTADELFATNNEKLRYEAKDWLKRTAEHCTVITVLIATVAFAAAYTIPGGPNQQTGYPLLLGKPLFLVFTVADVLSLAFALTAVVGFLSILTSSFQLKDFRRSLQQKLLVGFTLLFLSVSMMMVSLAATVILIIHNKERWTKIAIYVVSFFPVSIFMLSYIPLCIQLADTFKYWVLKIGKSLPRSACASRPTHLGSFSNV